MSKIIKSRGFRTRPIEVADIYISCNFFGMGKAGVGGKWEPELLTIPGTPVFLECNLVNCRPPAGSTVLRCNTALIEHNISINATQYKNKIWGLVAPETCVPKYKKTPLEVIKEKPV